VVWCRKYGKEIQRDPVPPFLSTPPAISVSDVIKIVKGSTTRKLFSRFPGIKKVLGGGHPGAPSYYVGRAGNVRAGVIRNSIERVERIGGGG